MATTDFPAFLERRVAAANAYVSGDFAPLAAMISPAFAATFFGPGGGSVVGAKAVVASYEQGAHAFEPGGESAIEILESAASSASDGVAYWTGIQRAKVRMHGKTVPMELRITEVFRRENDDWKLVHRHADMLASESKNGSK